MDLLENFKIIVSIRVKVIMDLLENFNIINIYGKGRGKKRNVLLLSLFWKSLVLKFFCVYVVLFCNMLFFFVCYLEG